MKIKCKDTYCIDLYEEPHKFSDHNKKSIGSLNFTGVELIEAIVSAGMPDVYLTKNEKRNRREEIFFKVNLFETFVVSNTGGKLSFDASRRNYLDSTEIGAINYWIGMVLITILGQKKYDYDFMVHLSMIELFSTKLSLKKHPFITSGKIRFKSPDLLAINSLKNTYGIFESKGYSDYNKNAIEAGYKQAKSIRKVNGQLPKNRLVVMTQTGTKYIQMIEKDPEGENCDIKVDLLFLYLCHFLPIIELIKELNPEERAGRMCGLLKYGDGSYSISVPLNMYEKLSIITQSDIVPFEKLLEENSFEEIFPLNLLSDKLNKRFLCVEKVE